MSPRVYTRKFDWDEARVLHAVGMSLAEIGRRLGVSAQAVKHAVDDAARERAAAASRAWVASGVCPDCGKPATRLGVRGQSRCRACWARSIASSVRDSELQCVACREWKPDADFPFNRDESPWRRGRHSMCRPCLTRARREYRERHKIPCDNCGKPRLPANEKRKPGVNDSGLCLACYRKSLRK